MTISRADRRRRSGSGGPAPGRGCPPRFAGEDPQLTRIVGREPATRSSFSECSIPASPPLKPLSTLTFLTNPVYRSTFCPRRSSE